MPVRIREALRTLPAYAPGRTVPGAVKLASNDRQPNTTSSPSPATACTTCWHNATDPQPAMCRETGAPVCADSACSSSVAPLSG